jgi:hypothetical protein
VEFVVDNAARVQVFSEYFDFSCQVFHRLPHTHYPSSSSGAGAIIIVDSVPPHPKKQLYPTINTLASRLVKK